MSSVLPSDVDERPISVIGGGTLGRRIAMMFSAGGSRVHLFSLRRLARGRETLRRRARAGARERLGLDARSLGTVELFDALEPAVATAWLIVESVSEDLALKKQVFRELDRLAESDAILATNSSSYPSSRLLDAVESPERLLNVHFQMPPEADRGRADVARQDRRRGHRRPRRAAAALRARALHRDARERRLLVQPHLARRPARMPDGRRRGRINPRGGRPHRRLSLGTALGPFRIMDRIGLDVVLAIEEHYATVRDGIPTAPRELLRSTSTRGSSASSPAGASTTTTATDRGRPKRSHDRGVHAASRRSALLRSTPRARSRPPCERGPIAARAVHGARAARRVRPARRIHRARYRAAGEHRWKVPGECTRYVTLGPGVSADTPVRRQGPGGSLPDRARAIPCTVRPVTGRFPRARDSRSREASDDGCEPSLTAVPDSNGDSNSSSQRQASAVGSTPKTLARHVATWDMPARCLCPRTVVAMSAATIWAACPCPGCCGPVCLGSCAARLP